MQWYLEIRNLHIITAVITAILMLLRLSLDLAGKPGWRRTPLKWLPHVNDTILLASALALVWLSGWMPFVHHWLTGKVVLLLAYIFAGKWALDQHRSVAVRSVAALVALSLLGGIFTLATTRPFL